MEPSGKGEEKGSTNEVLNEKVGGHTRSTLGRLVRDRSRSLRDKSVFKKVNIERRIQKQKATQRRMIFFKVYYVFAGQSSLLQVPGGGTRYISGWGGAARPLIP